MNGKDLFKRLVELSDETTLTKFVKGSKVKVGSAWLTIGERHDRLVLINDNGEDVEYSDLSIIERVEWVTEVTAQATSTVNPTHGATGSPHPATPPAPPKPPTPAATTPVTNSAAATVAVAPQKPVVLPK